MEIRRNSKKQDLYGLGSRKKIVSESWLSEFKLTPDLTRLLKYSKS